MADPTSKPQVHRLHDMLVEEVSLVDRAANRRKFIITKKDQTMPPTGAPVQTRSDGSLTAGAAATPQQQGTPPATQQAATPASPTVKASISLTGDAQSALADLLDGVISSLTDAAALVKGAKMVDTTEEMDPSALVDALDQAMGDLDDGVMSVLGVDPDAAADAEEASAAPADGAPAPPVTGNAPPLPPVSKLLEVRRAKRVIVKAAAARATANMGATIVQKLGARMKKERLSRLQQAFEIMQGVILELSPAMVDKGKKKPGAGGAQPYDPTNKPNPPEKNPLTSGMKKDDIPPAIAKQLEELQATVKKQAEELAEIRKRGGSSNAAPINGGGGTQQQGSNYSWPMDMNDPRDRKTVGDQDFFGR